MRGATFFWQVADGGTAYIWQVGATFFGSADFLKAPHTFGKFPMGGALFYLTKKKFKKAPIFYLTKKNFKKKFLGEGLLIFGNFGRGRQLIFGKVREPKSLPIPPPPRP